jgi:two-component system sensor histidine kinase KdpD
MALNEKTRPDPDELLALVREQEARKRRGRLRVFLGAAPGVGKTYAMLEAARQKRAEGLDVVAGVVETHGRAETEVLIEGIEVLPRRMIDYRGHTLDEFDLDGALARSPALVLVDELAHADAPGSRHRKRWQDVEELLDHGIDVYTTLNVQHLESLNDVVAQITGVQVRETVPDAVIERAESVVLVDLPPDDLMQRLREGKVYVPSQAEWAAENYFREGNLTALRELALRATAQRVNAEVLVLRRGEAARTTWPTSERILVCVGPSPSSALLVRSAKRLAASLHVPWLALYIESPSQMRLPAKERDRARSNLRLAEELGAETYILTGENVGREIVAFARQQNVSKIIVGKPVRRRLRDYLIGSPVDELIRISEEIDVHVIRGAPEGPREATRPTRRTPADRKGFAVAVAMVAAATGAGLLMRPYFELVDVIMVYLLGVMAVAIWSGRGPSIAASAASVVCFNFFFVPPRFTFAVADVHYVVTFAVMFLVALALSSMADRIRLQAIDARTLQRQTAALGSLSRELAATRGSENLLDTAGRRLADEFHCQVWFLLPDELGRLHPAFAFPVEGPLTDKDRGVAQWVAANGHVAGRGAPTLPEASMTFFPLKGKTSIVGVVGVRPQDEETQALLDMPDQQRLLQAYISQTALALEVDRLDQAALHAAMDAETERLRSSLLSALTHDIQTPLAAIAGSAESITALELENCPEQVLGLADNIHVEAMRLSRLVDNHLRISRLESREFTPDLQPAHLEEIVGAALTALTRPLREHPVTIDMPGDLPPALMDAGLMEQLFVNLLENAAKYTPSGTPVSISAKAEEERIIVTVADRGPGLPPEDLERIFERFYRVHEAAKAGGYGLGLAICRTIARLHGGRITAANRPEGGAEFRLELPVVSLPPEPYGLPEESE